MTSGKSMMIQLYFQKKIIKIRNFCCTCLNETTLLNSLFKGHNFSFLVLHFSPRNEKLKKNENEKFSFSLQPIVVLYNYYGRTKNDFLAQSVCFLDRHYVWRSLDPTLDISSDFVKKKEKQHSASFFYLKRCKKETNKKT